MTDKTILLDHHGLDVRFYLNDDGKHQISAEGLWWPGLYASLTAALLALELNPADLSQNWSMSAPANGRFSIEDLRSRFNIWPTATETAVACPWCRSSGQLTVDVRPRAAAVTCVDCGAMGPEGHDEAAAVCLWNERLEKEATA